MSSFYEKWLLYWLYGLVGSLLVHFGVHSSGDPYIVLVWMVCGWMPAYSIAKTMTGVGAPEKMNNAFVNIGYDMQLGIPIECTMRICMRRKRIAFLYGWNNGSAIMRTVAFSDVKGWVFKHDITRKDKRFLRTNGRIVFSLLRGDIPSVTAYFSDVKQAQDWSVLLEQVLLNEVEGALSGSAVKAA